MKFQMRIRSIPATSVAVKQSSFLSAIGGLNSDWGIESPNALAPEFGAELSAFFPLGKQLGKGITGSINYRFRGGLSDICDCDDVIDLEFNSNRSDVDYVLDAVLPKYSEAFDAYYGFVGNEEYIYTDFEATRNRNTRKCIIRVFQANYFSRAYICRITNGQSDHWLSDLRGSGWQISSLKNGILVRWPREILTFERGEELSRDALKALQKACASQSE